LGSFTLADGLCCLPVQDIANEAKAIFFPGTYGPNGDQTYAEMSANWRTVCDQERWIRQHAQDYARSENKSILAYDPQEIVEKNPELAPVLETMFPSPEQRSAANLKYRLAALAALQVHVTAVGKALENAHECQGKMETAAALLVSNCVIQRTKKSRDIHGKLLAVPYEVEALRCEVHMDEFERAMYDLWIQCTRE
jgi:hypothetical protein